MPERAAQIGVPVGVADRELEAAAAGRRLVNLTYADTERFPAPEWVVPAFVEAARGGAMSYTPYRGDPQVLSRVAANLTTYLGVPLDSEREVILTPGSQAALYTALAAVLDEGDGAIVFDPDYLSTERVLRYLGAVVHHVPLVKTDSGALAPDLEMLRRLSGSGAKLLIFSHPNNPTGAVYDRDIIVEIARIVVESDMMVIVDELYSRLVYEGRDFNHLLAEPGIRDRCVTLLGPSKTESMTGYRLGAAVGPAMWVDAMEDILGIVALRAPAYAQPLLTRWIADDADYIRRRVADYQRLRDIAVERLTGSGLVAECPVPLGTAYIFPKFVDVGLGDRELARALLDEARVIVNPGYQFGPSGIGHVRICFAQSEPVLDQVLDAILGVVGNLRAALRPRSGD